MKVSYGATPAPLPKPPIFSLLLEGPLHRMLSRAHLSGSAPQLLSSYPERVVRAMAVHSTMNGSSGVTLKSVWLVAFRPRSMPTPSADEGRAFLAEVPAMYIAPEEDVHREV